MFANVERCADLVGGGIPADWMMTHTNDETPSLPTFSSGHLLM